MNNEIPMAAGAQAERNDCSAQVMRTVTHKMHVPKASMNTPLLLETPSPSALAKRTGPGVIAEAAPLESSRGL